MPAHAHILDTRGHTDSYRPQFPAQQSNDGVTASHRIATEMTRIVTRRWSVVTPGQAKGLLDHYEANQGAFEITLPDGTDIVCIYREPTQVTQGAGGFGTAQATLEEVRTWD